MKIGNDFINIGLWKGLFIHEQFEYPLKSDKCKWYLKMKWEKLSWTIIKHKYKAKVWESIQFLKIVTKILSFIFLICWESPDISI